MVASWQLSYITIVDAIVVVVVAVVAVVDVGSLDSLSLILILWRSLTELRMSTSMCY